MGLNLKVPDIQLDHAVVRGINRTGGNLDLVVTVQNPNNFSLQGTQLQLSLDVEGSHLGDVSYNSDFAITQNGSTTLTLPGGLNQAVSFTHEGRVPLIRKAILSEQ